MTTAFQADAFQSDPLAFQIEDVAPAVVAAVQRGLTGKSAGPFRGPHETSKRRFVILPERGEEKEALEALKEAQADLEDARTAETAKLRREAIAGVFVALRKAGVEREAYQRAKAVSVQEQIEAASKIIAQAMMELETVRRLRRHEEEEALLHLLLS